MAPGQRGARVLGRPTEPGGQRSLPGRVRGGGSPGRGRQRNPARGPLEEIAGGDGLPARGGAHRGRRARARARSHPPGRERAGSAGRGAERADRGRRRDAGDDAAGALGREDQRLPCGGHPAPDARGRARAARPRGRAQALPRQRGPGLQSRRAAAGSTRPRGPRDRGDGPGARVPAPRTAGAGTERRDPALLRGARALGQPGLGRRLRDGDRVLPGLGRALRLRSRWRRRTRIEHSSRAPRSTTRCRSSCRGTRAASSPSTPSCSARTT